jgi:hypothetical protein
VRGSPNSSASAINACPIDTSSTPGTFARKGARLAQQRWHRPLKCISWVVVFLVQQESLQ